MHGHENAAKKANVKEASGGVAGEPRTHCRALVRAVRRRGRSRRETKRRGRAGNAGLVRRVLGVRTYGYGWSSTRTASAGGGGGKLSATRGLEILEGHGAGEVGWADEVGAIRSGAAQLWFHPTCRRGWTWAPRLGRRGASHRRGRDDRVRNRPILVRPSFRRGRAWESSRRVLGEG